jgi:hypothetical protein
MRLAMIDQFEVRGLLEETLPDISPELRKENNTSNIYKLIHILLDYTFKKIREHNITTVKKCFLLAEKLYNRGNEAVRCAVENIYVYSFSHLPVKNEAEKKQVLNVLPGSLYTLYMRQVIHSGI